MFAKMQISGHHPGSTIYSIITGSENLLSPEDVGYVFLCNSRELHSFMGLIYFQHCARSGGYKSVRKSSRSQGVHSLAGESNLKRKL